MSARNNSVGSAFDDFLKEEGIYEDVTAHAVKRVLAWQIEQGIRRGLEDMRSGRVVAHEDAMREIRQVIAKTAKTPRSR